MTTSDRYAMPSEPRARRPRCAATNLALRDFYPKLDQAERDEREQGIRSDDLRA